MDDSFFPATVVSSSVPVSEEIGGQSWPTQSLQLRVENGSARPPVVDVVNEGDPASGDYRTYQTGQQVILLRQDDGQTTTYSVFDYDRRGSLALLSVFFLVLVVIFARKRGITSVIGMLVSLAVLVCFVVPSIVSGSDPLVVSLVGCVLIAAFSLFLAHGFNKRTAIAFVGTLLTLGCVAVLAQVAVVGAALSGIGSEESLLFKLGPLGHLNLGGLMLAGMLIGTLGVLDDVTTAQSAAVEELKDANPAFDAKELYRRASSIGREHIASLLNTLVLAYVGASFPVFLLLTTQNGLPWWVTLNSEFLAEEIVRTLVGSCGLVLAVPITTFLASRLFAKGVDRSTFVR